MSTGLVHFLGLRTYSTELRRDLEELERSFNDLVNRTAPLFSSEPSSSFNQTTINTGDITGFAAPIARVRLTPQSGVAHTAMRSDAAPRLDVTINPTGVEAWTGQHAFSPAFDKVPVTINKTSALASAHLLNILNTNGSDLVDVGNDGHVSINCASDPNALLAIQQSGSSDFPVTTGLVGWYKADSIVDANFASGTLADAGVLTTWYDSSSNGNHLTAHGIPFDSDTINDAYRPTYRVAGVGTSQNAYLPIVVLFGTTTSDRMGYFKLTSDGTFNLTSAAGWTIFIVQRDYSASSGGGGNYFLGCDTALGDPRTTDHITGSGVGAPNLEQFSIDEGASTKLFSGSYSHTDGADTEVNALRCAAGTAALNGWNDGVLQSVTGDTRLTNVVLRYIGRHHAGTNNNVGTQGRGLYEMAIFNVSLSDADIATINAYLLSRVNGTFTSGAFDLTRWNGGTGTTLSRIDPAGRFGFGVTTPVTPVHVVNSGEQLRLGTSTTNYVGLTVPAGSQTTVYTLPTSSATGVLHNSASTLSWSLVNLTSDVTGILPIANGGTNSSTALGAFNNLSPLTTRGDLLTRDATNNVRIAIGGTGTILKSDGTDPSWNTPASVGIVTGSGTTGNLPYWTDGPNGVLGDTDLVYDGGSYTTTKPVVAQYFKTVADATHYATWAMDSFGTATFTISGGTPKSNFTHAVQIHSDTTAQFGVYTAAGTSALTTTISTGGTLLSITALSPSTGLVLRPTTTFTGVPIIDVQNASSISLFKIIENTGAATFSGDVTHSSTATSVGVHTFTAQDVHNGGISLGSSGVLTNVTAAGTTGFQLQDPTDRTAGANNLTASIETKDASATFHRIFDASWDGRYGFGYSVSGSQIAKTGHVLSFIQIDGNSPSGAPHYVGILSNVGHTSTGQTAPTGPYGLIGAAANTVASGMTGNLMVGTAGGVYSNSDTAFTGKIAAGLMANIAQTATTGNAEPTTLDVTMGNGGHFKGGYDHIAGLWVQTPRGGGSGTGYPTNLPGVVSGVRVNIPVWGAALAATAAGAASELWAIHGTGVAEGVNIKMWPTITGYIKMHYPRSTSKSTTRAVHAYWEPWPNTATIRGNAADGDTYFDDGTNFRKGLWEYAGGWAKLMQYTQTDAIAGAGGAATLAANTNGATGPTTAAQAKWAKIVCLDGTAGWIPVWV